MSRNAHIAKLPYHPEQLGRVDIDCPPEIIAGSMTSVRVTYTAGRFGIDDQGSVRFLLRFASDAGRPQFDRPGAPNYCSVVASNGTTLVAEYHPRGSFRPWFKAIRVNVMRDALREGDSITLTLGDRSQGSAGWRSSSMREGGFEVRVQADPWGTVVYGDVAGSARMNLVAGDAAKWVAVLPTLRAVGQAFGLRLRADDLCGNPVSRLAGRLMLAAEGPLAGLPAEVTADGGGNLHIEGLRAIQPGLVRVTVRDEAGRDLARSNPLRIVEDAKLVAWWGDFHAQSEETIGTNSARQYFEFARDAAFCDFVGHQGNDFQITAEFWRELNDLFREFNDSGRFVTLPGYEYSPMTHLGGDRNIYFLEEGRPIRRSSHALVPEMSDIDTDCNHVSELFDALRRDKEEVIAFAHVGGRYADLRAGHDGTIERSVEIHSSWGTFEWLLFDAFELGHRVGVVCNSDDHKGRPGASHPGASIFGAYGGLSCVLADSLSRASLWAAMKARHHYGTTGDRVHLEVHADFAGTALRYDEDPKIYPSAKGIPVRSAMMGDIVRTTDGAARIRIKVDGASGIERIDLRCGERTVETVRAYDAASLGQRVRVVWEGAEYRGRGRMTTWDGQLRVPGNRIRALKPINFWHLEKAIERTEDGGLRWESVTTGNFAGVDCMLEEASKGRLDIDTTHVKTHLDIASIGFEDKIFDAGGLGRRIRVFRLPDDPLPVSLEFERTVAIAESGDSPIYVRVTFENGHQAWSSPIYLFRND